MALPEASNHYGWRPVQKPLRYEIASITIRNIDDELKGRLRVRAAQDGHSMEEEARIILRRAVNGKTGAELLSLSEKLFGKKHGVDLELPSCNEEQETPQFN